MGGLLCYIALWYRTIGHSSSRAFAMSNATASSKIQDGAPNAKAIHAAPMTVHCSTSPDRVLARRRMAAFRLSFRSISFRFSRFFRGLKK